MGGMTIGLVIAVIVVIVVALIAMRWRSASGEQQALRHYQHALDTLRTVSDRMESSRPAVEPRSQARSGDNDTTTDRSHAAEHQGASQRQVPRERQGASDAKAVSSRQGLTARSPSGTVAWSTASEAEQVTSSKSVRQAQGSQSGPATRQGSLARQITEARQTQATRRPQAPVGEEPAPAAQEQAPSAGGTNGHGNNGVLVFEEDTLGPDPSQSPASRSFAGPVVTRAGRRALQRSARPQSRMPVVLGSLVIFVVLAVVVAVALGIGKHHTASPPTTARHGTAPGPDKSKTTTTSSSTTTSTTAPPSVVPEASTATTAAATYAAPAGNYSVTLTSSGACWVYAKTASTGAVLWTGTLNQGQAQQLTATGEIVVEMGHANTMSVTLNGVPVQYPAQYQAVFTMTFAPPT